MRTLAQRIDQRLAIGVVLLLHLVGVAALMSPMAHLILPLTPVNLLLTAFVMLLFSGMDKRTLAVGLLLGTLGYFVEVLGVHTGRVFGAYSYGEVLGTKVANVPLLIGLNWSMLVFAIGSSLEYFTAPRWCKVMVASCGMVFLDLLIEPVAVHLGFWSWEGGMIPLRNYVAWGAVSLVFFTVYFMVPARHRNPVAPYVLLAQVAFFAGLNVLLGIL